MIAVISHTAMGGEQLTSVWSLSDPVVLSLLPAPHAKPVRPSQLAPACPPILDALISGKEPDLIRHRAGKGVSEQ